MSYKIIVIDKETNKEVEKIECDGFELGFVVDKDDAVYLEGVVYDIDNSDYKHLNIIFEEILNDN